MEGPSKRYLPIQGRDQYSFYWLWMHPYQSWVMQFMTLFHDDDVHHLSKYCNLSLMKLYSKTYVFNSGLGCEGLVLVVSSPFVEIAIAKAVEQSRWSKQAVPYNPTILVCCFACMHVKWAVPYCAHMFVGCSLLVWSCDLGFFHDLNITLGNTFTTWRIQWVLFKHLILHWTLHRVLSKPMPEQNCLKQKWEETQIKVNRD